MVIIKIDTDNNNIKTTTAPSVRRTPPDLSVLACVFLGEAVSAMWACRYWLRSPCSMYSTSMHRGSSLEHTPTTCTMLGSRRRARISTSRSKSHLRRGFDIAWLLEALRGWHGMTVVRGAAMVALGVTVVVLGVGLVVPACVLYSVVCCYGVCHCDFMLLGA